MSKKINELMEIVGLRSNAEVRPQAAKTFYEWS
jgi:hypothetical protein